jgi:hypothetical protein
MIRRNHPTPRKKPGGEQLPRVPFLRRGVRGFLFYIRRIWQSVASVRVSRKSTWTISGFSATRFKSEIGWFQSWPFRDSAASGTPYSPRLSETSRSQPDETDTH